MDGVRTIRRADGGWPPGFDDLAGQAPEALHVRGADAGAEPAPWVAVVGTRSADPAALHAAREIAGVAARLGCCVISGGAMGVDAAAHEGALEAGGRTVAVLAGGVDRPSPAHNQGLFRALLAGGGGLWSEHPAGQRPHRGSFLHRNRLIAAAAAVTIVVQARARSGALSTAAHARRLGRRVAAVPGGWRDASREGCAALLRAGATPVMGPADVAALLGRAPPGEAEALGEDERAVVEALRAGVRGPDGLAERTGLPLARCMAALTGLEVAGVWKG